MAFSRKMHEISVGKSLFYIVVTQGIVSGAFFSAARIPSKTGKPFFLIVELIPKPILFPNP